MELDGPDLFVFHSFDDSVVRPGDDPQPWRDGFHRLVVPGVDGQGIRSEDACEEAAGFGADLVGDSATVLTRFRQLRGDVLIQGSAQDDVHKLLPAADGQDGHP